MMKLALLLVCAAVALIEAQEPPPLHPCKAPNFFQARMISYDRDLGYYSYAHLSYDGLEQKERLIEELSPNATRPQVDQLFLYRENKRFVVDLRTRKCNVTSIDFHFHPIEVSENARSLGRFPIGLDNPHEEGLGVAVGVWASEVKEETTTGNLTMSFTAEECIPVNELFIGRSGNRSVHLHRSFYDVTVGLNDPGVFDIPPECHMKEEIVFDNEF